MTARATSNHAAHGSASSTDALGRWIDLAAHPIDDDAYRRACAARLDRDGALVLPSFFTPDLVDRALADVDGREGEAFYASSTHNVWLDDGDPSLPTEHVVNRQVASSKGLLADDQLDLSSPLRAVYGAARFRRFVASVVGVDGVHPYADRLSSVNVHFHRDGEELGWHFDNSSFAVTTLLQAPDAGGHFEFVANVRDSQQGSGGHETVADVLDRRIEPAVLDFAAGDLVLFRGRESMHRVTPSRGPTTRVLVVFAFNERPGIGLSASAMRTFYGRT